MQIEKAPIADLLIIKPKIFEDPRGFFFESFNECRFKEASIDVRWVQDNHARSSKDVLRGLHFQKGEGQAKLVRCVRGCVWDVAVDIRPDSSTFKKWHGIELSEENKLLYFIPQGFAHGYLVLSEIAEVLYKCSSLYDPKLETEVRWDDPQIAVQWPTNAPIISERDQKAQSLEQYLGTLRTTQATASQ